MISRVAIIDPSLFTPPYDHHLCHALGTLLGPENVYLVGPRTAFNTELSYRYLPHFYRRASSPWFSHLKARKYLKGVEHFFDSKRLIRKLNELSIDVAHFQWTPLPLVDALTIQHLQRQGIKTVLTVHDTRPFNNSPSSRLQVANWHKTLLKFDQHIVHSEYSKNCLEKLGVSPDRISIIPHGILETPSSTTKETALASVSLPLRVLFFGNIKPYKGLPVLIKALALLSDKAAKSIHLTVAGVSHMDPKALRALAISEGVDQMIHWDLRFIPDNELRDLYDCSHLAVFPYLEIDSSGALLQAIGNGMPVITTNVGGLGELVRDGVHGRVVEPNSPFHLASALSDMVENPAELLKMSKNVVRLASDIPSWETIGKQTIATYEKSMTRPSI